MERHTIISKDIRFRGNLKFDHVVKIDGIFQGTIESKGNLIIGPTGEVDADIKTINLEVYGKLKGNVIANNKISLKKNSYLRGDIQCKELEIESGSKFIGTCMME
ncbi:MAG: polymer-forming cytoskeletal protein [Leptospiraceae bacterium]|nr:polymer-forming cytoskeletal protein [Leptospiraceae bacterium]MDW7975629.1 polymer-forming cytoskeletal protein [Leptospiraceae bacterium]